MDVVALKSSARLLTDYAWHLKKIDVCVRTGKFGKKVMRILPSIVTRSRGAVWPSVLLCSMATAMVCVCLVTVNAATQPPPVEEFVPIDELPEGDRLPAAPFLIAAYSLVWIFAFGYFWMLSRRLSSVERELADLTRRNGVSIDEEPEEAS